MVAKRNDGWDLDEGQAADVKIPSTGRVRGIKIATISVLICGVLAPGMLIIAGAAIQQATSRAATSSQAAAVSSPGRIAATIAINQWLTDSPAPLVDAQILSWDGAKVMPTTVVTDRNGKTTSPEVRFVSEIDAFSLVDGFGAQYTASIQVQVDPRTQTGVALGSPSLLPVVAAAGDGWQNGGPWPGLNTVGIPDAVSKATAGWAAAYTGGDGANLRIAVGDPDATHTYIPLAGVDQVTSKVQTGAILNDADPSVMIIQVKLALHWVTQPALTAAQAANTDRPGIILDVLVERANTGAPLVTAWGAPGTGTTLTRYGNAINGVGHATTAATPTITGSPSPGSSGSPTSSSTSIPTSNGSRS